MIPFEVFVACASLGGYGRSISIVVKPFSANIADMAVMLAHNEREALSEALHFAYPLSESLSHDEEETKTKGVGAYLGADGGGSRSTNLPEEE